MVEVKAIDLEKKFGDFQAVYKSSLSVREGEILTLLGPSGSGKSTILRMIAGLIFPTAGKIFFDDRDVTFIPSQQRNTALVFQNYALFPHMSVAKNVEYGLVIRKVPKEERKKRVKEALKLVKMEQFMDRMPNKLSGGQQQRVALARALVVNPDVLLLDEPLSNLDAKLRVETRQEIRELVKSLNLTAIFVTHDQSEALAISDKIAVMEIGFIRQIGTPSEIWEYPETAFVGSFIGDANMIEMTVQNVKNNEYVLLSLATETESPPLKSTYFRGIEKVGNIARVVIRPDKVRITTQSADATNYITGIVKSVQFFGRYNLVLVELTEKHDITVYDSSMLALKKGETVYLNISPQDVKAFGPSNY